MIQLCSLITGSMIWLTHPISPQTFKYSTYNWKWNELFLTDVLMTTVAMHKHCMLIFNQANLLQNHYQHWSIDHFWLIHALYNAVYWNSWSNSQHLKSLVSKERLGLSELVCLGNKNVHSYNFNNKLNVFTVYFIIML